MDKIVRIDMSTQEVKEEQLPEKYRLLGGRGLTSRIIADEVEPTCHPLGEKNKLVIACGLLAGTPLSSSGRISIGAKSPLTGGIKESNGGGITAQRMAKLGIRAVIIEGAPAKTNNQVPTYLIKVAKEGVEIVPAEEYRGMGNYKLAETLQEKYGRQSALITIGPVGERRQSAAGIANIDREGSPSRYCGRGGMGAVMGSKGIKAIVIDSAGGKNPVSADKKKLQELFKKYTETIRSNPLIKGYTEFGTAGMLENTNAMGILPTRNFSTGVFEDAEKIGGEALKKLIESRGGEGETEHNCMPGCIIKCSNVYPDSEGKSVVSPLEYETIGLLGSNCDISDLDTIAKLNYLCNDYGIDTIETGAALAVAMDGGVIPFGDEEGAIKLLEEIGQGTVMGRLLAEGAETTGRVLGVTRIPVVKGQAMPAYEPRGIKGLAITYATSPQGADHTAGNTIRAEVDHRSPEGHEAFSKKSQKNAALFDTLGLCIFVGTAMGKHLDILAEIVSAHTGKKLTDADLVELGDSTVKSEREFNTRAGFTSAHDRLPEHFVCEISPSSETVFDVLPEHIDRVHEL